MIVEEPDSEKLVFRTDENTHALGAFRAAQQIGSRRAWSRDREQQSHALQIFKRVQIFQQIGVTAHDQLRSVVSPPDQLAMPAEIPLRQLIEFGAVLRQCGFKLEARFRQRAAANSAMRKLVASVSADEEPRAAASARILDLAVLADQHHSARSGSSRTNSICFSRELDFG